MIRAKNFLLLMVLLGLAACGETNINNPVLEDTNSDEDIVEVTLTAKVSQVEYADGVASTVWSYNGIVPGPTIEANLGDTLIVHFYNELPEATTVHWHGLELPANMDGSMIAQKPVKPGGYFRYEFKLLRASTFWYHPHMRGNEQVELGLQGMLVVRDDEQSELLALSENEHLWVLDDILLDDDGKMVEVGFPADPAKRAAMQVNGREGNVLLVNGLIEPKLYWPVNKPQRIRIVNSANTRFMRLSIPGHTILRIGGDAGLLETPLSYVEIMQVDVPMMPHMPMKCEPHAMPMPMPKTMSDQDSSKGLLLTPGERADIVIMPIGNVGDTIRLQWHDIKRGRHSACVKDGMVVLDHYMRDGLLAPKTLVEIELIEENADSVEDFSLPTNLRNITPISTDGATVLPVKFGHTMPNMQGDIKFFISMMNGAGVSFEEMTAAMAPTAQVGDVRIIEVVNMTMGDHNFHMHGFMFQPIEVEYIDMDNPQNNRTVPATYMEEKDTIILPRRTGMKGRSKTITRLAIRFGDEGREGQILAGGKVPTETESGGWLFHCHLLDHGARGMASFMQVVN